MRLIVTRSDNRIKDITDITHPIIKQYAEKCGADFMILDHDVFPTADGMPHYRILKMKELFDSYDRILCLDSDILIANGCPNLFDVVPADMIGTVLEDGVRPARERMMKAAQLVFGDIGWNKNYINTGVFICSKEHKDIFHPIKHEYWLQFGSDDVHLSYQIQKNGHNIMDLPYIFNHTNPWPGDRFKSYIIHYAGTGFSDKEKHIQIKEDYQRLKDEKRI